MIEALQFEFMRSAIVSGLLAGVLCGVMGTLAVANRMVFLTGGIAHATYGGIGLALVLGLPFLAGTLGFALLAAVVMAAVSLTAKHRSDAIIGVIWALGMALGIVLIDLSPGYQVDLFSYLFGSILAVPGSDIIIMSLALILAIAMVWYFYPGLVALSYDDEFARVRGVPVKGLYFLMVIMLALAVVLMIRVVGLILVIALLSIAPLIAARYVRSMARMMVWSSVLNVGFILCGLLLAYYFNLTAGACIILVAGIFFFLSLLIGPRMRSQTSLPEDPSPETARS
jgi:zinc transport system permease protein